MASVLDQALTVVLDQRFLLGASTSLLGLVLLLCVPGRMPWQRYGAVAAVVGLLAAAWCWLVNRMVPEPYLDEVFHIPQAQVYCEGAYSQWDDKITTPPGLYYLALAWVRALGLDCSPANLRAFNTAVIAALAGLAAACRAGLEGGRGAASWHALHTGLNIGLFPVLFFFSGLYYTDVLSTCVVLAAFLHHLRRVHPAGGAPSLASDVGTVLLGSAALFMRQTNVFWVVPFLGGLEAVAALKALTPPTPRQPPFDTLASQLGYFARLYAAGHLHDPAVDEAEPQDLALAVLSLAVAAVCHLPTVLRRVYPHLVVAALFGGFVYWNGGVVLGDKSNHVATLHLAQMLYLWPLVAFFSAPLFLPQAERACALLAARRRPGGSPSPKVEETGKEAPAHARQPSLALAAFNRLFSNGPLLSALLVGACLAAGLAIAHWNTIVHPFTLADNRHYMFYVFRYTIRRHPVVRHALVPVYLVCGYFAWAALYGRRRRSQPSSPSSSSSSSSRRLDNNDDDDDGAAAAAPPASTVLVLVVTTAASLVTAPLVEPRYFILPWVFWRLLVPSSAPPAGRPRAVEPRLVAETLWFALVNLGTMYVFLTRPFLWRAADGSLLDQGRQQRFMW